MSAEQTTPPNDAIAEELVAYLDGELDQEANRRVERKLSQDVSYRQRLRRLQQSWDLLEYLPQAEVDESFTQSTVAMVAVRTADDVREVETSDRRRRRSLVAGVILTAALTFLVAFVGTRWMAGRDDRQLLRDLPVIERVDEYRYADNIEFLRLLAKEGLFTEGEIEDDL